LVLAGGATVVLRVSKEGRFFVELVNLVHDYGMEGAEKVARLFAEMDAVK
jgi:hypothetical protein